VGRGSARRGGSSKSVTRARGRVESRKRHKARVVHLWAAWRGMRQNFPLDWHRDDMKWGAGNVSNMLLGKCVPHNVYVSSYVDPHQAVVAINSRCLGCSPGHRCKSLAPTAKECRGHDSEYFPACRPELGRPGLQWCWRSAGVRHALVQSQIFLVSSCRRAPL